MPKFAANLSFFYLDRPLLDRIAAAGKAGFKAVEFMFPYEETPETVKKALDANSLSQALINAPAGDWAAGERGLAVLEGRDADFAAAIDTAVKYAVALGCPKVNVLAGINNPAESYAKSFDRLVERFGYAADQFAKNKINLLLEHINPYDMPGYFVNTPAAGLAVLEKVNRANAKLQYDIYHAQRTSGELTAFLRDHFDIIDHIQVADNPARHQPGTGEINYPFLFNEIDRLGYKGWIGLEYKPDPDADGSLGWISAMGYKL